MLTALRNATKGWTARILLLLLVASFAVWGVSGSMFSGVGNAAVTVGETRVSLLDYRLAYDRQINLVQRQLGQRITREQAEAFGVGQSTLSQVVTGAILDEAAREMGLGLSDDKLAGLIGEDEAFRDGSGRFSRTQLQAVLRTIGMREEDYVQNRKQVAIRTQIIEGAASGAELPDAYWDILSAYQAEKRVFDYVILTEDDLEALPEPTSADIEDYYDENLRDYLAPEYRKLTILKLEAEDIADPQAVSDEDVRAEYEAMKENYTSPERRRIDQIVFPSREEAQAAVDKLAAGTTFDEVLAELGRAPQDVDLGLLAKGEIPDTTIADAAFALEEGATSEVVDGLFGAVVLRVGEVSPESTRSFEEVSDELRSVMALERATEQIFDTHDMIEDERAAGESLARAAQAAGLQVRVVEAVDRNAVDPDGNVIDTIPQSNELLAEAFDTDEGVEVDPIAIGTEGFVWYEVSGVTPERQKPLDEVRETVIADWKALRITEEVEALAARLADRADQLDGLEAAIREVLPAAAAAPMEASSDETGQSADGVDTDTAVTEAGPETLPAPRMKTSAALLRTDSSRDLPNAAVRAGFSAGQGETVTAEANTEDEDGGIAIAVLQVKEIQEGVKLPVDAQVQNQFNVQHSDDLLTQMVARMQEDREVTINRAAIEAALAR